MKGSARIPTPAEHDGYLMDLCDCRRPTPDNETRSLSFDAVQCKGCRGWVTGMMVLGNRWGFTPAEIEKLFRDGE